jgi:hypothetical protein
MPTKHSNAAPGVVEYCDFIRKLTDERLDVLTSIPFLGQDILEHASFCRECGPRLGRIIKESGEREFATLPVEKQARLNDWAAEFVKRNFPSAA